MDAVEYLKEARRMCKRYEECSDCPLGKEKTCYPCGKNDNYLGVINPIALVEIVENWSSKNQAETRQSVLLKLLPDVATGKDGVININPCGFDKNYYEGSALCNNFTCCSDCRKNYWLEEIV